MQGTLEQLSAILVSVLEDLKEGSQETAKASQTRQDAILTCEFPRHCLCGNKDFVFSATTHVCDELQYVQAVWCPDAGVTECQPLLFPRAGDSFGRLNYKYMNFHGRRPDSTSASNSFIMIVHGPQKEASEE